MKKYLISIPIALINKRDIVDLENCKEEAYANALSGDNEQVRILSYHDNTWTSEIQEDLKNKIKKYNYKVNNNKISFIVLGRIETYKFAENETDARNKATINLNLADINEDFSEEIYFEDTDDEVYTTLVEHFVKDGIRSWDFDVEFA